MLTFLTKPITVLLIVVFTLFSFGSTALALDTEPSAGAMIADTLLARPMGAATTIVGSALFLISVPYAALGGNAKAAFSRLIKEPFLFTFKRPLGDF